MKREPTISKDGSIEKDDKDDEDDDDGDDDIVIVSRPKLNLPPMQYSKQYYDLNMNGLENELRRLAPSLASISSTSSSTTNVSSLLSSVSSNNIASMTKSPIKPSKSDLAAAAALSSQQAAGNVSSASLRRAKLQIRQRLE